MVYNPVLEKRERPNSLRAINDLVRDNKIAWLDFFFEAANGREGDDGPDTERAEGSDVGTSGYLMWCKLVMQAMTSKKGYRYWLAA